MPDKMRPPGQENPEETRSPSELDKRIEGKTPEEILARLEELLAKTNEKLLEKGITLPHPPRILRKKRGRPWSEEHRNELLSELLTRFEERRYGELTPETLADFAYGPDRYKRLLAGSEILTRLIPKEYRALISLNQRMPEAADVTDLLEVFKAPVRIAYTYDNWSIPAEDLANIIKEESAQNGTTQTVWDRMMKVARPFKRAPLASASATRAIMPGFETYLRKYCTPEILSGLRFRESK